MTCIIDYGMANLRSVQKALLHVGADAAIIDQPEQVERAERLILPGVGAFVDAIANLHARGLAEPIKAFIASGKPFLGICLGLQLLFEASEEDGEHTGLGVLAGRVVRFRPTDHALKVPHMGWNSIDFAQPGCALFRGLRPGSSAYFVHSYYAAPADTSVVAGTTDYAGRFCCVVHTGNIYACQFHPEKSQAVGLTMLRNFTEQ